MFLRDFSGNETYSSFLECRKKLGKKIRKLLNIYIILEITNILTIT